MYYRLLATAFILCTFTSAAWAQDVSDRQLGAGYAHIISFEAEPEIAAATFTIDNDNPQISEADLKTVKLPLYREFEFASSDLGWYAQGTLGYLEMEETLSFDIGEINDIHVDQKWTGYGVLFEAGLIIPVNSGFSLLPGLGFGVSHLENNSHFSSAIIEDLLSSRLDGVIYNWDTKATVARGNLALRYDQPHGNYRIKGKANLSYSAIDSYKESSRFAGFSNHAGTFSLQADIQHPLNIQWFSQTVSIIGHAGFTGFIGSDRDALGFSQFYELGASVGLGKFTLGMLGIFGDEVSGGTVTFNYDY